MNYKEKQYKGQIYICGVIRDDMYCDIIGILNIRK